MKKIMITLVMVVAAMTASAQNNTLREAGSITIQPKVGLGIGYLSGSWQEQEGVDNKCRVGFVAGVEGEYYFNNWLGAALGVNYAQQGWKFEDSPDTWTTKLNYLNIPVTANFYIIKGLALKTGVQFGFLVSAREEDEDDNEEFKDRCHKFNFSIPVGISYEYKNVILDLRYNISTNKSNKDYSPADNLRSDLLQLTIGYKFALN